MIQMSETDAPVLSAVPREDGYGLKVWCDFCDRWHYHGFGEGHRIAYCHNPHHSVWAAITMNRPTYRSIDGAGEK